MCKARLCSYLSLPGSPGCCSRPGSPRPSPGGRVSAESDALRSDGRRAGAPGCGGVDTSPCRAPVRLPPHSRGQSRPGATHCLMLTGDILLLAGQGLCWGSPASSPELTVPQTRCPTRRSAGTVETNLLTTYLSNFPLSLLGLAFAHPVSSPGICPLPDFFLLL